MLLMDEVHQTAGQILDGFCENHTDLLPAVGRKRLTNTPVRGQLKWPDEWRTESFCTKRRKRAEVQLFVAEFASSGIPRTEFCRSRDLSSVE